MRTWVVAGVAMCMVGFGIAIEVALHISRTQDGGTPLVPLAPLTCFRFPCP